MPARPIRSISVLIPTLDGAEFLERVLRALAAQRCEHAWDLRVVDSGSRDGTLEIVERARADFPVPFELERIHPLEFDHGDTRNRLAARSRGDLLVFLTQDAIPTSEDWLATLARDFDDPQVGAAYCRNVVRATSDVLTRVFSANDPSYARERREVRLPAPEVYASIGPHERRLLYDFNDVASAIRRELWELHPFPRTDFGEDLLMSRALLEAGWTVVYDARATVEHAHDYTPGRTRARARIDARFNAEWLDRVCVARASDADALVARQLERDRAALREAGIAGADLDRELERARELRAAAFHGLHEGGQTTSRRAPTRVRERASLRVLYVVHGFPPETWAGTEVYTLSLAKEVQRLGHEVEVLARSDPKLAADRGGPREFALERGEFQGLTVWRVAHRIEGQTLGESYRHPTAEQVFEQALERIRPDVVHFQHLLHFSAGLIGVAARRGVPTVLTLNDYWGLCARVQLIRPDGVRCDENQEMGCLMCVKQKRYADIARARRWFPLAAPLVAAVEFAVRAPKAPSVKAERILHKRRVRLSRWASAYRDMQRRNAFVLGEMARADLVIAPSRFLRSKYLEGGPFDPARVVYSDYGMSSDQLRALGKAPDPLGRFRVGFVGSLVWYKGVDVLIEAFNRLAGRSIALNVFGDFRPEQDEHHAKLRDLARFGNVSFRGRFANERLAEVYSEIDVLAVPSVWFENSPLVIHEAFLLRTPVVTSDIGGMAELVSDGVTGLHFKVGDPDDLATKLARFVDEPRLAAELSRSFPRLKTIEEDARDMEYRYRGLASIVRAPTGG